MSECKQTREQARKLAELEEKNHALRDYLNRAKRQAQNAVLTRWQRAVVTPVFIAWRQLIRERKVQADAMKSAESTVEGLKNQFEQQKSRLLGQVLRTRERTAMRVLSTWTAITVETTFRAWRQVAIHAKQERHEQEAVAALTKKFEAEKRFLESKLNAQKLKISEAAVRRWQRVSVVFLAA